MISIYVGSVLTAVAVFCFGLFCGSIRQTRTKAMTTIRRNNATVDIKFLEQFLFEHALIRSRPTKFRIEKDWGNISIGSVAYEGRIVSITDAALLELMKHFGYSDRIVWFTLDYDLGLIELTVKTVNYE